jgi:uncharacterized protein
MNTKSIILTIILLISLSVFDSKLYAQSDSHNHDQCSKTAHENCGHHTDLFKPLPKGTVQIDGYLGEKLDLCIENRVKKQSLDDFILPFEVRDEPRWGWRGEFWGKWYTSAMLGYIYQPTKEYKKLIDKGVNELIKTQGDDGYIGTSPYEDRINGNWDIWGRKYVLLGLMMYYQETKSEEVLEAAMKHTDQLIREVGAESGNNIAETGWVGWKGLASSSVLEPVALLYQETGEQRYLDFANYIVDSWNTPNELTPTGLKLIQGVLEGTPMWKLGGAPKAYEMTSCFEGLAELYRITKKEYYLDACIKLTESILENEITIIGSGSMAEIWCNTKMRQTEPMYHAMETCATVTWMKFLYQMLRLTGNSMYADELESALYNALLAAMTPNGEWWSYFTGLMGERTYSHLQFDDMASSCCVVNGPRGLLITPSWAVMSANDGVVLNLYGQLKADAVTPGGKKVSLSVDSEYPVKENVSITIDMKKEEEFCLKLRIPKWSRNTKIKVNGQPYNDYVIPGTYANIKRNWSPGDKVEIALDMRTRIEHAPAGTGDQALVRGPIVLAFDSRLLEPQPTPKETPMLRYEFYNNGQDYIDVELAGTDMQGMWMTFNVPVKDEAGKKHILQMCDFASAGNTWEEGNYFRTWIQQPFDVRHLYIKLDWKVNTSASEKPVIPGKYKLKK